MKAGKDKVEDPYVTMPTATSGGRGLASSFGYELLTRGFA